MNTSIPLYDYSLNENHHVNVTAINVHVTFATEQGEPAEMTFSRDSISLIRDVVWLQNPTGLRMLTTRNRKGELVPVRLTVSVGISEAHYEGDTEYSVFKTYVFAVQSGQAVHAYEKSTLFAEPERVSHHGFAYVEENDVFGDQSVYVVSPTEDGNQQNHWVMAVRDVIALNLCYLLRGDLPETVEPFYGNMDGLYGMLMKDMQE